MRSYSNKKLNFLFSTCRTCVDLGTKRRQVSDVTSLAHLYLNFLIQLFHSLYLLTSFMAANLAGLYFCGVERNDKDAFKPVARHLNLPDHSKQHMAVCGLSLHIGSSKSSKTLEQKFVV